MLDRCEIFRDYRTTILLCFLNISTMYTIRCGFYKSLNTQNRMCKLCTFFQIRSHLYTLNKHTLLDSVQNRAAKWIIGSHWDPMALGWTKSSSNCVSDLRWPSLATKRVFLSCLFPFHVFSYPNPIVLVVTG